MTPEHLEKLKIAREKAKIKIQENALIRNKQKENLRIEKELQNKLILEKNNELTKATAPDPEQESPEPEPEVIIKKEKKKKKPIVIIEKSSSSDDDDNVIYIKKKSISKKKVEMDEPEKSPVKLPEPEPVKLPQIEPVRTFNPFYNMHYRQMHNLY